MKQIGEVAEHVAACTCVVGVRRGIFDVVHDMRRRRQQEGVVVACGHYSSSTAIASANKTLLLGDCTLFFTLMTSLPRTEPPYSSSYALSPIIFRVISLSISLLLILRPILFRLSVVMVHGHRLRMTFLPFIIREFVCVTSLATAIFHFFLPVHHSPFTTRQQFVLTTILLVTFYILAPL